MCTVAGLKLVQCFSAGGDFAVPSSWGRSALSGYVCGCHSWGLRGMLLTSGGRRPGMLLNLRKCVGQPHPAKSCLATSVIVLRSGHPAPFSSSRSPDWACTGSSMPGIFHLPARTCKPCLYEAGILLLASRAFRRRRSESVLSAGCTTRFHFLWASGSFLPLTFCPFFHQMFENFSCAGHCRRCR